MPIYEFHCHNCSNDFERLVRLNATNPECPQCASQATERLLSAPAFRLKGSGWYETDFKSDKERRRNLVSDAKPESTGADKSASDTKKADNKAKADKGSSTAGTEKKTSSKSDTKVAK